ncbi:MAG: sigma-70 family RNA polymerase sigma factor [Planctomycetaceae bacterium]
MAETARTLNPENWVDDHGDYLHRYAWSRLRDANAAEEAVQETLLAAVRYADQYSGNGSERGWLLGILKRKIVDYIRRRQRYERDGSSYDDDADPTAMLFDENGHWRSGVLPDTPDKAVASRELWDVVRGCLDTIPKGQADVFVLSVMEEMDSEEVCKQLQITPSNLWVRLHRARLGLANCVGSKWFADGEAPKK